MVVLGLVAALGGWWFGVGRYTDAPQLVSLSKAEAQAQADRGGLLLTYAEPRYDEKAPKDSVLAQNPASAAKIVKGGTITLTLSLGPERFPVPDVIGKEFELAEADLVNAKLVVAKGTARYDDSLPAGVVVDSSPKVGTEVKPGAKVTVILSRGRAPITVPNLVGKSLNDARTALAQLGLVLVETYKDSDKPRDEILGQSPADGAGVEKGTQVKLDVSKGPPLVAVPRVIDLPCQQAKQALEGQGFPVTIAVQPERRGPDPEPGRELAGAAGHPGHPDAACDDDAARPVGSHTPTSGGLAKAALPYADATGSAGGAGLRLQLAGLGAAAPATRPRTRCSATAAPSAASRSTSTRRCWSTSAPPPRPRWRGRRRPWRTRCAGAGDRRRAAWCSTPAARSTRGTPRRRCGRSARSLLPLLDETAAGGGPLLLVEPSAGGGRSLASRVEQLGPYLDAVDRHPGLGVCFDTCHAWAAGHDLAAEGGMTATLDTLVATVGRGPAEAGARQRLEGPVRLHPGPAREHRQGQHRRAGLRRADGATRPPPASRWWWRPRRRSTWATPPTSPPSSASPPLTPDLGDHEVRVSPAIGVDANLLITEAEGGAGQAREDAG